MNNTPLLCIQVDEEIQLRLHEALYAEEYFALIDRNHAHLRQWMPWLDSERTVEDLRTYMRLTLLQFANNEGFQTSIWYGGKIAGSIGYDNFNWQARTTEIGYWLGTEFQGKGIMTRACRALVTYAFEHYQLNKIRINCATGNTRSRAIPERLGFKQEGVLRQAEWLYDHYVDHVVYGLLAREQ